MPTGERRTFDPGELQGVSRKIPDIQAEMSEKMPDIAPLPEDVLDERVERPMDDKIGGLWFSMPELGMRLNVLRRKTYQDVDYGQIEPIWFDEQKAFEGNDCIEWIGTLRQSTDEEKNRYMALKRGRHEQEDAGTFAELERINSEDVVSRCLAAELADLVTALKKGKAFQQSSDWAITVAVNKLTREERDGLAQLVDKNDAWAIWNLLSAKYEHLTMEAIAQKRTVFSKVGIILEGEDGHEYIPLSKGRTASPDDYLPTGIPKSASPEVQNSLGRFLSKENMRSLARWFGLQRSMNTLGDLIDAFTLLRAEELSASRELLPADRRSWPPLSGFIEDRLQSGDVW